MVRSNTKALACGFGGKNKTILSQSQNSAHGLKIGNSMKYNRETGMQKASIYEILQYKPHYLTLYEKPNPTQSNPNKG